MHAWVAAAIYHFQIICPMPYILRLHEYSFNVICTFAIRKQLKIALTFTAIRKRDL